MTVEQLLNKLIEKGWRPYEDRYVKRAKFWYSVHFIVRPIVNFVLEWYAEATVPLKEILTSEESWFRQFCIANHLLKKYSDLWDDDEYVIWRRWNWMDWKTTDWEYIDENYDSDIYHQDESYQYRIIESALKDKNELEDFLLQNIRIEDESNQNT